LAVSKYTILVIPEGSHRVRRFMVRRTVLQWVGGIACILLVVGGLLFIDYLRTSVDRSELSRLREQNHSQQRELQRLIASLDDLRKEMVVLSQNDAKVRVMAQLTRPKAETLMGVGGPPEIDSAAEISDIQRQIDQIRQDIDLRRESQEEVRGFLNDQRSLLAAKPRGWPVKGWTTSGFGIRNSPFSGRLKMHEGIDIAARTGTPVYAAADGIVSQSETVEGYGKLVTIDHGYGYKTYYAHNSKNLVRVGQRVKRNDLIAAVGNTGSSTGSHLHYEGRLNGIPLNPKKFL